MIGVDHVFDTGDRRHMSSNHDLRVRRELTGDAAHLPDFTNVHDDGADANHVVIALAELVRKCLARREIEQSGWSANILLNHFQAPRPVEHAQGKRALRPGHLVVVKLHRIDGTTAELIVTRKRSEYR